MKKQLRLAGLIITACWMACTGSKQETKAQLVKTYYLRQIAKADSLVNLLHNKVATNAPQDTLQLLFKSARLAYKKAEFLAEYYNPLTAKSINGAPIPSMDENDQHKIDAPEGFQVIEPFIFPKYSAEQKQELLKETGMLKSNFIRLKSVADHQELADAQIFDALRNETFRVITLGISGFDAAIAQNSMAEAAQALESVKDVLEIYGPELKLKKEETYTNTLSTLNAAIRYLTSSKDFNKFDRMHFITTYANPASAAVQVLSRAIGNEAFKDLRAVRVDTKNLFDKNAFNADYYTASFDAHSTAAKAQLGRTLFYDVMLSGSNTRSCASCHKPEMAFTDGLIKNISLNGKSQIRRNTPTLLNAGFQASLFYDNRVSYLEDQATEVINNADEMHGSLPVAVTRLKQNQEYVASFKKAFPKSAEPVTEYNIRNALASYIRSLTSLDSRFDKYVRGDRSQMNASELNGFNLYMGKAKCATCHFTPLFNGTVPPDYRNTETEVIGVPAQPNGKVIDADLGKYNLRKLDLYKYAFKTPTVRNISLTAPYMHNGAFKTLEEVMEFYNEGGSTGLGFDLPNQTLPFDQLNLSKKEIADIISFLKTLDDKSGY